MATRTLNRRRLRDQVDAAGPAAEAVTVADTPHREKAPPKVAKAPRVRKPRAKKAAPRMFARWGVFDQAMKQVAIFDYNQRSAADEKLADLNAKKKPGHFLQIVKEPMAEPEPVAEPASEV
ncbi:MAG TPA: hypothetical protein VL371_09215 [Gemmataceae bacterium]|jgi:hypothetical protein|nr:hypothetical protein [Gemmataceae bacterium]